MSRHHQKQRAGQRRGPPRTMILYARLWLRSEHVAGSVAPGPFEAFQDSGCFRSRRVPASSEPDLFYDPARIHAPLHWLMPTNLLRNCDDLRSVPKRVFGRHHLFARDDRHPFAAIHKTPRAVHSSALCSWDPFGTLYRRMATITAGSVHARIRGAALRFSRPSSRLSAAMAPPRFPWEPPIGPSPRPKTWTNSFCRTDPDIAKPFARCPLLPPTIAPILASSGSRHYVPAHAVKGHHASLATRVASFVFTAASPPAHFFCN